MKNTVLPTVVTLGALFLASGCNSKDPAVAPPRSLGATTFATWTDPIGGGLPPPVPGLGIANIAGGTWNGEKVFVVWADQTGGSLGAGSLDPRGNPNRRYWCSFGQVVCECETADGKTGTLHIAGNSYDLADGAFFLLSTLGEKPRVKQLKRDLTTLKDEASFFKELAKSDAEIRAFFVEPEKAK